MKKIKTHYRKLIFALIFIAGIILSGLSMGYAGVSAEESGGSSSPDLTPEYTKFEDLDGKVVGMLTGAPFEELVKSKAPGVKEIQYFSSVPDMLLALKTGKVDAAFINNAIGDLKANKEPEIAMFPISLGDTAFGFAFTKGGKDREKWQAAYDKITDDQKAELWKKWTGADDSIKTIPKQDWPGNNGTVSAAVCDTLEPMCYAGKDGELIGFEIEMILLVAKELDVHVEFKGMEFAAVMPEVQSGKSVVGAGSIVITDERKKSVDFIEHYPASYVLNVRSITGKEALTQNKGDFLEEIKSSFHRTFIKEGRYKMILSGMGLTVVMAISSGILGMLLAFGLVFLRRIDNIVINKILGAYSALVTGIPVVVILMVLYYIVFGKVDAPAVAIAIVGFTFIFASRAYGVIWNAVGAVDKGQREAALALGYNESLAFRKVILPQARNIYLPVLQTQFVLLLKETSVAGYITVLDLTRAGDLIRSRTMEAFFPLFAIAAIYFVLTFALTKLLDQITVVYDKKKMLRKIKGVD